MIPSDRVQDRSDQSWQAEAGPVGVLDEVAAAPKIEYLSEDEIVQISLKPSPWFIPIVAARDTAGLLVLAAIAWFGFGGGVSTAAYMLAIGFTLAALLRVAVAALQWASRFYVLTNRRVMVLSGIMNVSIAECELRRIAKAYVKLSPHQTALRIGSIVMQPDKADAEPLIWQHIARPAEIYQHVVKAIRKSHGGKPG